MLTLLFVSSLHLAAWQHPAGMITDETIVEVQLKIAQHEWASKTYQQSKASVEPWVRISLDDLTRVFPTKRGNVYHNFSCPDDRIPLRFDPFDPNLFHCDACSKDFTPEIDPGVYPSDNVYHGTLYDGWACRFYQTAAAVSVKLALIARVENNDEYGARAVELLNLFAKTIRDLPTEYAGSVAENRDAACILTYKREGDNKVLFDLAQTYELVRNRMTPAACKSIENDILERMLNDIMLEPSYAFDHNNIYQYHRTILQTAAALERYDLIDWVFGYGNYSQGCLPTHRSLDILFRTHFKPDGAYWELCSGYHLYPLYHFCEMAVLTHNLTQMDSVRFPPTAYDLTDEANKGKKVIKNALEWFFSMAMPDRTMTVIGDSPQSRAGMDSYIMTAEVGYRFYDVKAVGDYANLREGQRSWEGLLYGAPEIEQRDLPFTSSYLSSGWVSLRNKHKDNRLWVGLNALKTGGGHQHADRLSLTLYSHGKLLALEKATPYNDEITRELGTLSQSHNTVTVDMTSQKQGEALPNTALPEVTYFFSGPDVEKATSPVKYAEIRADNLYPQTSVYRRTVAVIEDVVIDMFQVEGGKTHDWIVNHAGSAPVLSVPTDEVPFEPAAWLANGTDTIRHAAVDGDWTAQWQVDDVTSRLTMFGRPGTQVYALETYPVDNARITPDHPPCQTLCVRRTDNAPFIAIWDAWRDTPNFQSATFFADGQGLCLKTQDNTYYLLFGPSEVDFGDGVRLVSNTHFSLFRGENGIAYVDGTELDAIPTKISWGIVLSEKGSMWGDWSGGPFKGRKWFDIEYETIGGKDILRDAPMLSITFNHGNYKKTPSRPPQSVLDEILSKHDERAGSHP